MKLKAVVPKWGEVLCRDLFHLHTSHMLCDVLIDVQNSARLPVHSNILAAGSPVFRKALETQMAGKQKMQITTEFSLESWTSVLKFLYTGEIEVAAEQVESLKKLACHLHIDPLIRALSRLIEGTDAELLKKSKCSSTKVTQTKRIQDSNSDESDRSSNEASKKLRVHSITSREQLKTSRDHLTTPKNSKDRVKTSGDQVKLLGDHVATPKNSKDQVKTSRDQLKTPTPSMNQDKTLGEHAITPKTSMNHVQTSRDQLNTPRGQTNQSTETKVRESAKNPGVQCPRCHLFFRSPSSFRQHGSRCIPKPSVERALCPTCGILFANKASLVRHLQLHAAGKIPDPNMTKSLNNRCAVCSKTFKTKTILDRHKLTHTSKVSFYCDQCALGFKYKSSFIEHQRRQACGLVMKDKMFACHYCDKSYAQKKNLTAHVKNFHLQVATFECSVCHKECGRKYNLELHMRRHTNNIRRNGAKSVEVSPTESCVTLESNNPVEKGDVSTSGNLASTSGVTDSSTSGRVSNTDGMVGKTVGTISKTSGKLSKTRTGKSKAGGTLSNTSEAEDSTACSVFSIHSVKVEASSFNSENKRIPENVLQTITDVPHKQDLQGNSTSQRRKFKIPMTRGKTDSRLSSKVKGQSSGSIIQQAWEQVRKLPVSQGYDQGQRSSVGDQIQWDSYRQENDLGTRSVQRELGLILVIEGGSEGKNLQLNQPKNDLEPDEGQGHVFPNYEDKSRLFQGQQRNVETSILQCQEEGDLDKIQGKVKVAGNDLENSVSDLERLNVSVAGDQSSDLSLLNGPEMNSDDSYVLNKLDYSLLNFSR